MNIKTVYIEITNRCNLNCRTCYNRSGLNKKTQELSINQIEHIISLFSTYGAKRFLFSGGEPSLHSDFDRLLELIRTHPELSFGFVTNGTSQNPTFIQLLNHASNITLQISLDGSCEEKNQQTRGIGHFDQAVEFVKSIHNPTLRPLLKMVISQNNLTDVKDFYRLAISLRCIPEFAFIYRSGNGEENWENKKVSAQDKIKILRQIDSLNQQYQTDAYLPRCTSTCPFVKGTDQLSVCIKVDGSIQPCQSLYSTDYTLANALHFDPNKMDKNLARICSLARERTSIDFGCERCMLHAVCGRGCMAEAVHLTGDPLGNDDSCLYRKLQFLTYDLHATTKATNQS
ncbi:MAG: radical SAM protein [Clostridia bacterium]|nr:radical SAM protein [Clostridia bacterium]